MELNVTVHQLVLFAVFDRQMRNMGLEGESSPCDMIGAIFGSSAGNSAEVVDSFEIPVNADDDFIATRIQLHSGTHGLLAS